MATNISIDDFQFRDTADHGKHSIFLEVDEPVSGTRTGIPLLVANGDRPGKTLVVFAGVHGDELEGVQAVQDVFLTLETAEMSGRLIAIPAANLPACLAVTRNSPVDALNLARVFPGRVRGTVTERIAHYLGSMIIPEADLFLDLHSSGVRSLMPTMAGYDASATKAGKASEAAARAMGMPVIWGHKEIGPGRSISVAAERRIPWLYVESPNGGRVSKSDLRSYSNGILNLLGHLGIINRDVKPPEPRYSLIGSGNVDTSTSAGTAGFFVPHINLMDRVERGEPIGEIRDIFGSLREIVRAEHSGIAVMLRATPIVEKGDGMILVAEEKR